MAQVLGLTKTTDLDSFLSENARRNVFHQYPQGAAILMFLLSMMDTEAVDKTEHGWWEQRHDPHASKTASANAAGPFTNTSGTDLTQAGWTQAAGTSIRIYVDDASQFRVRDGVWVKNAAGASSTVVQIKGVVTALDTASNYLTVRLLRTVTNGLNTTANNDLDCMAYTTIAEEAGRSKEGGHSWPTEVSNYTQISRSAFRFSGSALKEGLRFDSRGIYQRKSKQASLRHMELMERTVFWGEKRVDTVTNDDNDSVPERKTGGLYWFLEQWEKGNTGNGGSFDYRPNGDDVSALSWTAAEDKRIIPIAGSTITGTQFEDLMERLFRKTNDQGFEKLCLCGSGFLKVFNRFCAENSYVTRSLTADGAFGMKMTSWESQFGDILFKTHPHFNETDSLRYSAFFLDTGNLMYHPLNDRDTELLKNRQPNDADYRKDEWLTEWSIEVNFPESCMFIDDLRGIE